MITAVLVAAGGVLAVGGVAGAVERSVAVARMCDSSVVARADLVLATNAEDPIYGWLGPEPRAVRGTLTIPAAGLAAVGAVGVEGTVAVRLESRNALGSATAVRTLDLRPTPVTGQDVVVPVFGYATAALVGNAWGSTTVEVDSVQISLTGKRADRSDIPPVSTLCTRGEQPATRWYSVTTMDMRVDYAPAPTPFTTTSTADTITAQWGPSDAATTGYQVLLDDSVVATTGADSRSAVITGLVPDTAYYVQVRPITRPDRLVRSTPPIKLRTLPRTATFHYAITGSAAVNGAVVPLRGSLHTVVDAASGKHSSELALNATDVSARGVSAHVEFEQAAPITGSLSSTVFTANARVAVVVKSVTVRGRRFSVPVGCRTAPIDLPLRSRPGFDLRLGGELTAAFTVPPLTGCGPLTAAANTLLSGSDHRATLLLTP
ncbi:hypothetical protein GCM10010484_24930 [Actinokineospora globicatena]